MGLINGRPGKDFVVGTYSHSEINDLEFMHAEEKRAREELSYWGYEYAYTKIDLQCNGQYVRAYRVYTDKEKTNL